MRFYENKSVKKYNTFGVDVRAQYFATLEKEHEIAEVQAFANQKDLPVKYIGSGSNVLFVNDYAGLVVKVGVKGRTVSSENENMISITLGAGEDWHEFVTWAVAKGYEGVENLALIPGTIGGAVVGNIAAYGQNVSDVLESVTVNDAFSGKTHTYSVNECELSYRSSIFKRQRNLVVLSATFKLRKEYETLETAYHERKGRFGGIEEVLQRIAKPPYSMQDIYNAVVDIRTRKLPDPRKEGTVGSIFINPVVTKQQFIELSKKIPELQSYPVENLSYTIKNWEKVMADMVKIPAGRLLDFLGWSGVIKGNVSVSPKHALCVVTNKKASGQEIYEFFQMLQNDVHEKLGVYLETEIDIIK
jgi:UDP-N-acetylmuramate dehydrogenase